MKFKGNFYVTSFLLAGLFLVYPALLIPFTDYFSNTVQLLSLSTVSSLALSYILFNYSKLNNIMHENFTLKISLIFIFCVGLVHFFIISRYNFDSFSLTLLWITIPLFVYIFHEKVSRDLPVYIVLFWLLDLLISFTLKELRNVGIVGNINWHASFLIVGPLFYFYLLYRIVPLIKKSKLAFSKLLLVFIYLITVFFSLYSCYLFYLCYSRAATISLILIIILLCVNYFPLKKIVYIITIASFISIIFFASFLYLKQNKTLDTFSKIRQTTCSGLNELHTNLYEDVRLPLWRDCINMILTYPLTGTGVNMFESTFATHRSIDYFTRHHNAARTNHPHNTLLYVAATLGIPALFFWCILWIYPLIYCLIYFARLSLFMKVVTLSYFSLFFGGLLDLTLFHWPTLYIAAILVGLLWKKVWGRGNVVSVTSNQLAVIGGEKNVVSGQWSVVGEEKKKGVISNQLAVNSEQKSEDCNPFCGKYFLILKVFIYTAAILVLLLTIINIYNTFCSTYYFAFGDGSAKVNCQEQALYYYKKGISYKKNPKYIYKTGKILTNSLDNPQQAYYFFNSLNEISPNFSHSNAYTAFNLIKLNRKKDAIPYLTKEVLNYPLSAGAWYRLFLIQKQLKMYKEADSSLKNSLKALLYKGLPPNAMKLLIANPQYDFRPWDIPENILNRLKNEYKRKNGRSEMECLHTK